MIGENNLSLLFYYAFLLLPWAMCIFSYGKCLWWMNRQKQMECPPGSQQMWATVRARRRGSTGLRGGGADEATRALPSARWGLLLRGGQSSQAVGDGTGGTSQEALLSTAVQDGTSCTRTTGTLPQGVGGARFEPEICVRNLPQGLSVQRKLRLQFIRLQEAPVSNSHKGSRGGTVLTWLHWPLSGTLSGTGQRGPLRLPLTSHQPHLQRLLRHLRSSTQIPHPDLSLILSTSGPWLKVWRNMEAGPVLHNGVEEFLEPPSTQTL